MGEATTAAFHLIAVDRDLPGPAAHAKDAACGQVGRRWWCVVGCKQPRHGCGLVHGPTRLGQFSLQRAVARAQVADAAHQLLVGEPDGGSLVQRVEQVACGGPLRLSDHGLCAGPHQPRLEAFGLGDAVVAPARAARLDAAELAGEQGVLLGQGAQQRGGRRLGRFGAATGLVMQADQRQVESVLG